MTHYGVSHSTNGRFIKAYSSEGPMRGLRENCRWRPYHLRIAVRVGPTEQAGNYQVHLEEEVDLYDSTRPVLG